jgi:phage terminase small subunit
MPTNNSKQNRKLTEQQKVFCREYVKTGNGKQSAIKAGYSKKTAEITGSKLLRNPKVGQEIDRLSKKREEKAIADAADVMVFLTKVMNGEILDQFGLDASLNDRIKAAQELAKRTVDIENRIKGVPDNNVNIKIDWKRD